MPNFDTEYAPQNARPSLPTPLVVNSTDASLGLAQQRQQTAREDERRGEIHEQHALPQTDVVVLDRAAVAEHARVVQQAVEPAVAGLDLVGERLVLGPLRSLEIELRDRGLGPERRELLIERVQQLGAAAVQQHGRAVLHERARDGAADAGGRAGHEDHAPGERVGGGR